MVRTSEWADLVKDLTIDLWLCKITPPATLRSDFTVEMSDTSSATSLELTVNSF